MSMPYGAGGTDELALANAAILTALLEALVHKKVLLRGDVRGVLADAVQLLESRRGKVPVKAAIDIIIDNLVPRFAERRT